MSIRDAPPRIDVSDPHFYDDPDDALRWLLAEAPVYLSDLRPDYPRPFWIVSKWEDIRAVEAATSIFQTTSGIHLGAGLIQSQRGPKVTDIDPRLAIALKPAILYEGAEHRRLRSLAMGVFKPRRIAQLDGLVARTVEDCLDTIEPGVITDFVAVANRIPLEVICELLGIGKQYAEQFKRWSEAVIRSFEPGADGDFAAMIEMLDFLESEVEARRQSPREDAISDLVYAEHEGSCLSTDEILMWCWQLLVGGQETTASLIAGGLKVLLERPEEYRTLVAEPALIPGAIEEMLRWVTPDLNMCRTAVVDATVRDTEIAQGDLVFMSYLAANRDPDVFPDPFRFDVRRRPSHLSFGFGPHYCIGSPLARLEATTLFERLLARFPHARLAGAPERVQSSRVYGLGSLPVLFGT